MYMHVHPHTQCQNIYMYIYTVYIPYALSFCSTHMQLGITTVKKNYILTEDKLSSRNKNIWNLAIINSHLTAAFIKTCLHSLRNYLALHTAYQKTSCPKFHVLHCSANVTVLVLDWQLIQSRGLKKQSTHWKLYMMACVMNEQKAQVSVNR